MKLFHLTCLSIILVTIGCQSNTPSHTKDAWDNQQQVLHEEKQSLQAEKVKQAQEDTQPIPMALYRHGILVIEKSRKTDFPEDYADMAIAEISRLLRAHNYDVFSEKSLRDNLYREMEKLGLDPNADQGKYMEQMTTQGNLMLYVTLEKKIVEIKGAPEGLNTQWIPIVKLEVHDLLTGAVPAIATQEGRALPVGSDIGVFRPLLLPQVQRTTKDMLRQLAAIPAPDKNLFKVIARSTDEEVREKLNGVFTQMQNDGNIDFMGKPFIAGANFTLQIRYKKDNSGFVDILREYLANLNMRVETQGYAIVVTPKDSAGSSDF